MDLQHVNKTVGLIEDSLSSSESPCITSAFQMGGVVLLHLARATCVDVPVILIDSGYLPSATLEFAQAVTSEFGFKLDVVKPSQSVMDFESENGGPLYSIDPDRCCEYRRVIPGHDALKDHDLWLTAVRRSQSIGRSQFDASEPVELQNGVVIRRVAPLVGWEWGDLLTYADANSLPRHPLYSRGYTSIGCAPCSRPTWGVEDERSGRWNGQRTECGLHSVSSVPVEVTVRG